MIHADLIWIGKLLKVWKTMTLLPTSLCPLEDAGTAKPAHIPKAH